MSTLVHSSGARSQRQVRFIPRARIGRRRPDCRRSPQECSDAGCSRSPCTEAVRSRPPRPSGSHILATTRGRLRRPLGSASPSLDWCDFATCPPHRRWRFCYRPNLYSLLQQSKEGEWVIHIWPPPPMVFRRVSYDVGSVVDLQSRPADSTDAIFYTPVRCQQRLIIKPNGHWVTEFEL